VIRADGLACLYDLVKAHSGLCIAHIVVVLSDGKVSQVVKEETKPSKKTSVRARL
jgi:hypothetical protein